MRRGPKEANIKIQQTQRQEEFQCACLNWEVDFKSSQLKENHDFEASLVIKEAKFRVEVTQRRLAQWVKINKESQKGLADHVHMVDEILLRALPESAILLLTSLNGD